ncbi:hypothetical protein BG004_006247 [Podila humilis]|nr:hypothetical protein BG004_006247 [Podila humilis]
MAQSEKEDMLYDTRDYDIWTDVEDYPQRDHGYSTDSQSEDYSNEGSDADIEGDDMDEDEYNEPEIYGDFRLTAPKNKSKPVPTPKPKSHTTTQPVTKYRLAKPRFNLELTTDDRKRVYIPPEVIRIVCSFASQETLRAVLSLVCREWYLLAKPFIKRKGAWKFDNQAIEDALLEAMTARHIHHLEVHYAMFPVKITDREEPFDKQDAAWIRFFSAITTPLCPDDADAVTEKLGNMCLETQALPSTRSLISFVEKMTVISKTLWDSYLVPALLPHLSAITSLNLQQLQKTLSIPLFTILDNCHELQELYIASVNGLSIDGMTICCDGTPIPGVSNDGTSTDSSSSSSLSYPLKIFEVQWMVLEPNTLSRLCGSCPGLKRVVLESIALRVHYATETILVPIAESHLHLEPLYRLASLSCPDLEVFQICLYQLTYRPYYSYNTTEYDYVAKMILRLTSKYFPQTKHLSIFTIPYADSWQPTPEECLFFSQLTHINVKGQADYPVFANLDKILRCARSLRSLNAQYISFRRPDPLGTAKTILKQEQKQHQEMRLSWKENIRRKLEREAEFDATMSVKMSEQEMTTSTSTSPSTKTPIILPHPTQWLCRNLETLDIGNAFICRQLYGQYLGYAQVLFLEFLAKTCPMLVNLTLKIQGLFIGQHDVTRLCTQKKEYALPPPHATRRRHRKCFQRYQRDNVCSGEWVYKSVADPAFPNDLLLLCGGDPFSTRKRTKRKQSPRLVHLKQLKITGGIRGVVCSKTFDFMGSVHQGYMPWPKLEHFVIRNTNGWEVQDHPSDESRGNDTLIDLQEQVMKRRPGLEFSLGTVY